MIPIIAIANLLNGVLSLLLLGRLYSRYRQRVSAHYPVTSVRYFMTFYFVLSVLWLLYATPGILTENLMLIMFFQSLADVVVIVGAAVGVQIAFYCLKKRDVGVIISLAMITLAMIYLIALIFSATPSVREVIPPYVYWHPTTPTWLRTVSGIAAAFGSLVFISTFTALGLRIRDNKEVRRRSFYLAGGMAFLFVASLTFFIFNTGGFFLTLLSALLGIAGLFVMLLGIPYRDEQNEQMTAYFGNPTTV